MGMVAHDTHVQVPYAGKFSIAGLTSRIMYDAAGESALRVVGA